jgi:hypothetical protein
VKEFEIFEVSIWLNKRFIKLDHER